MKKLFLSIVMLTLVGAAFAQTPEEKAALKAEKDSLKAAQKEANSLVSKGVSLREAVNTLHFDIQTEQAKGEKAKQNVIDEKNAQIQDKAKESSELLVQAINSGVLDEKKMFEACKALDEVSPFLINPQVEKAAAHEELDTVLYSRAVDDVCLGCYGVIKYGNMKSDEQKLTIEAAKLKMPKLMTYYAYLCIFYTGTKNLKGMEEAYEKYANFAENYPLVADDEEVKNPNPPVSQSAFNIFNIAFDLKDADVCEKYFKPALGYCDEMAKIGEKEGDAEEVNRAEEDKDRVLSTLPYLYRELGDTVKWKQALEEVVRDYPESEAAGTALQNILSLAAAQGPEEMARVADEMLAAQPQSKVANYGKGYSLFSQEKYEEAVEYFKKATELDPTYEEAFMMAGMSLYRQALNNYYEYIDNKSFKSNAAMEEAENKYVKSYFSQAKDYFEKCRELAPERVDDWAGPLQNIYSNLGEKEKAAEMQALIN